MSSASSLGELEAFLKSIWSKQCRVPAGMLSTTPRDLPIAPASRIIRLQKKCAFSQFSDTPSNYEVLPFYRFAVHWIPG